VSAYDPAVALQFFKSAGKPERIAAGATVFEEHEKAKGLIFKSHKMYLLLDGEVDLVARKKVIGTIGKGQVFGEMASLTDTPRTASAVAKSACEVIALDDKQFQAGLKAQPAFVLMLMSMMIGRLRETIEKLEGTETLSAAGAVKESVVFDPKRLGELVAGMTDDPPAYFDRGKVIVREGQTGMRMYVVIKGTVAVSVTKRVVERLAPGGVFGELALVEQSPRLASVFAETDCEVLPVNRAAFLQLVKMSPDFAASLLSRLAERLKVLTSKLK
jgi:CRP-like cAMP-binding protein